VTARAEASASIKSDLRPRAFTSEPYDHTDILAAPLWPTSVDSGKKSVNSKKTCGEVERDKILEMMNKRGQSRGRARSSRG
jgi:hypothetical protein